MSYTAYFIGGDLDLSKKIVQDVPPYYHHMKILNYTPYVAEIGEIPMDIKAERETYRLMPPIRIPINGVHSTEVYVYVYEPILNGR